MWPFKKHASVVAAGGQAATINAPESVQRMKARLERLRQSAEQVGHGARRIALMKEITRIERDLRKAEAIAAIDRGE